MDLNESNLLVPNKNLECLEWKTFSWRKHYEFKMNIGPHDGQRPGLRTSVFQNNFDAANFW